MSSKISCLSALGRWPLLTLALLLAAACQTTAPAPAPAGREISQHPSATAEQASVLPATGEPAAAVEEQGEQPTITDLGTAGEEVAAAEGQVPAVAQRPDPEEVRQQAVEACESATQFLDEGNLDDATAALDRAYELLLSLDGGDDPAMLDVKDDLRMLVAERLTELYASQRTAAGVPKISWDLEIPLVSNADVQKEIKSFQTVERESFLAAYRRSGIYRPMILEKLAAAGLPSQLSWLPMIESAFKVKALSRARALGMWQFISSTGNRFGLRRDTWVDERMDPERSTDGAIAYLSELHDMFGDWPKAMAGYNCGASRVQRLERRSPGEDLDFWDLYQLLPRETRRYIPRFFATLLIVEDPAAYGFELPEPLPPQPPLALVPTSRCHRLDEIDQTLGLAKGTIAELNPELRKGVTPDRAYQLKVPVEHEQTIVAGLDSLPVWKPPQPEYTSYRVRRGDTLSTIARRFGTSATRIAHANGIRNVHRIGAGTHLKIPVGSGTGSSSGHGSSGMSPQPATATAVSSGEQLTYTVRRGDTLYQIARRFQTTAGQIMADNSLRSSRLYPGNTLTIRPGAGAASPVPASGDGSYMVKRGDTPIEIARAHGVSLAALLQANNLTSRSKIYPGQRLVIP